MYWYFIGVGTGCACASYTTSSLTPSLLFIPQFYIMMKKLFFFFFAKPVLVIPVPAIVGVFESIWSDVKLVGFCLCNVSMVRLYFMFSEYCGVSVHGESPSFEIEVH